MGFFSSILGPVGTAVGSMLGGPVGGAIGGALGGALGGSGSSGSGTGASTSAQAADPFASQRYQYQPQLSTLMRSPIGQTGQTSGLTAMEQMLTPGNTFQPNDPSYQFRLQQGMDAVNRGAAHSGLLNSGNRLAALETYGQGMASTEFANEFQRAQALDTSQQNDYQNAYARLAQLSGANTGQPGQAGQLMQQQSAAASAQAQQIGTQLAGTQWGQQATGWVQGLFGGGSSGSSGSSDLSGVNYDEADF